MESFLSQVNPLCNLKENWQNNEVGAARAREI